MSCCSSADAVETATPRRSQRILENDSKKLIQKIDARLLNWELSCKQLGITVRDRFALPVSFNCSPGDLQSHEPDISPNSHKKCTFCGESRHDTRYVTVEMPINGSTQVPFWTACKNVYCFVQARWCLAGWVAARNGILLRDKGIVELTLVHDTQPIQYRHTGYMHYHPETKTVYIRLHDVEGKHDVFTPLVNFLRQAKDNTIRPYFPPFYPFNQSQTLTRKIKEAIREHEDEIKKTNEESPKEKEKPE